MPETVLAFDFGTRSIGVSAGVSAEVSNGVSTDTGEDNTSLHTANELPALRAKDGIPDWQQITALINEWQPTTLLVGLPLNMDGSEQEMTRRARKFAQRLHGRFRLKVELVDERLTTREAKELAFSRGHRGNFADKPIDSIAARLLLEAWWNGLSK